MKAFDEKILVDTFDFGYEKILTAIAKLGLDKSQAEKILNRRLALPDRVEKVDSLFKRLLISAQNANGMANIIGRPILGVQNLNTVFCEFNPQGVLEKFKYNNDAPDKGSVVIEILTEINDKFPQIGLTNDYTRLRKIGVAEGEFGRREVILNAFKDPLNSWNKFARTVVDGAIFLSGYKQAENFYSEADEYMKSDIHKFANIIQNQVYGIGYALACDFLKEVGIDCGKPDVHIKAILEGVTNQQDLSDQDLQKAMQIIAVKKGIKIFAVDKVFWMIGTTNFSINICDYRESFIQECVDRP